MSVKSNIEKLLPFTIGEFNLTDNENFIDTLCPNELEAFGLWVRQFEFCGGFRGRNFDAFYLYEFFMAGNTTIEVVNNTKTEKKKLKFTAWLSFVNGEYKNKSQDELVDMYVRYLDTKPRC